MTCTVAVVVPNLNGLEHLPECFAALDVQSFRDFEVLLIDNGSTDGSAEWMRENAPACRVLELGENGGFAKAVNAGIRASDAPYVALLNNDTNADPRWLAELVAALEADPSYDFAASLMLLYDRDGVVNAAGDGYDVARMTGLNRGLGEPEEGFRERMRVFGACAGAAIYRRSMFDDVGLFDEDFFLLSEDTDVNLRALIAGKRCLYVPAARVRHKLRATIGVESPEAMKRLTERNEMIVFAKDMPWPLVALAPALWLYRQLRMTVPIRPSKWRRLPELVRDLPKRVVAEREGWRIGWSKRRSVWSLRRAGTLEIVRWVLRGTGPA